MRARILVNARPLLPPRSGVGRYVGELLRELAPMWPESTWKLFYHATLRPKAQVLSGATPVAGDNVRHLLVRVPFRIFQKMPEIPMERFVGGLDLYHEPNFLPLCSNAPTILTVHDCSFLVCPETLPAARALELQRVLPGAMERARGILVPTERVKGEVHRLLGVSRRKIAVTPEAASSDFTDSPSVSGESLAHLGLEPGYLLSVGTLEPRKGFEILLAAHERLGPRRPPLVVVGRPGWGETATLPERARGRATFLTDVADADLPALYRGASLFALASRYEGFGLPVLEAMASGTPVLCSPAVAEVAGDAARIVKDWHEEAWADAMGHLLEDRGEATRLTRLGRARAASFSWNRCARLTIAAYGRVLRGEDVGEDPVPE